MLDMTLRPIKDRLFDTVSRSIPLSITPLHITAAGFLSGLICCVFACAGYKTWSLLFWAMNRGLDCLDGAVARHRNQQSDLGGFADLLADFTVYALVPMACAWTDRKATAGKLLVVAGLEASFWINNFVLFYIAALVEKKNAQGLRRATDELTSLAMRPALVEGFESAVFFTLMLAMPGHAGLLSSVMFVCVVYSTWQRGHWLVKALGQTKSD